MLDYSTTNLLQMIRDLTYVGSSTRDWPDAAITRVLNREIHAYVVPMIEEARAQHFVTHTDTPLVAGQSTYPLPTKAMGSALRGIQLVDASGNPYAPLSEFSWDDAINYGNSVFTGATPQGVPSGYRFEGNTVVLYPTPSGSPTLSVRMHYVARPSTLVANAACAQILSSVTASGTTTLTFASAALPASITTSTLCDLIQNKPGFDVQLSGFTPTAVTATTVAYLGTLPALIGVGDWIALTDQAPVVTGAIPDVLVGCLVKKVSLEIMSGKGDDGAFNRLRSLLSKDEKSAREFLRRRNTGDHAKAGQMSIMKFRRGIVGA